jgi:hypothetical protein
MLSPMTNSMMDRNLFEVSLYGSMMSRAVRDEPEWIVQVADQMEGVLPQRKGELITIARQPRPSASRGTAQQKPVQTLDRNLMMSPKLLFFDPPKNSTTIAANSPDPANASAVVRPGHSRAEGAVRVVPASSSSGVSIIPAARVSKSGPKPGPESAQPEKPTLQSDDEFQLQPAVPPVGPTATGPAGSGPATSGNR